MQLAFLEKNLSIVPAPQLELLTQIIAAGSCAPLVAYMQQRATTEKLDDNDYEFAYELAFEYAIHSDSPRFIDDIFNYDEILKHLDQNVLMQYAEEKKDTAFKKKVLTAIVNTPSKNMGIKLSVTAYFKIEQDFIRAIHAIFNSSSTDSVVEEQRLIRDILFNPNINTGPRLIFLSTMLGIYFEKLETNPTEPAVTQIFLNNISLDPDCVRHALVAILSENHAATLNAFMQRFPLTPEQLITTLSEFTAWDRIPPAFLKQILDAIATKHPKYPFFLAVYQCMLLPKADKAAFLQAHIELLNPDNTTLSCRNGLVTALDKTDRKIFIDKYIDDTTFTFGDAFKEYIFDYGRETVKKYLIARHTILPDHSLLTLEDKFTTDPELHSLVAILIARSDYRFNKRDVFRVLRLLAQAGNTKVILVLLNNDEIFNLLKQYHLLNGDGELPHSERGTLLPALFACLTASPDKWKELFASLPEAERKNVLKGCVPRALDSRQLTLGAYLIQCGHAEFLKAVNAINSRFVCPDENKRYAFFVPRAWRRLETNTTLRNFQHRVSVRHAEKLTEKFTLKAPTLEQQTNARKIAVNLSLNMLTFQHHTYYGNTSAILAEGKLKSRLHLRGNTLTGKASAGLSDASHSNNDPKAAYTFFTRVSSMGNHQASTNHFSPMQNEKQSRFVLNARQLLIENPHIKFLLVGYYRYYGNKTVVLPLDYPLHNEGRNVQYENKIRISLSADIDESLLNIHTKLFECLLIDYIQHLPEPVQAATMTKLTRPQSEEDYKLIHALLDFLPIEWCVPGDVALRLSYVDAIEYGAKVYDLAALRQMANSANDADLRVAIKKFTDLKEFPFVVTGLLKVAVKRGLKATINTLLQIKKTSNAETIVYQPNELYEIDSLAQLLLEDLDNSRVYAHFKNNILSFESTLKHSTNRGGAHHAEMAKLRYALGMNAFEGQNAMLIVASESFALGIGEDQSFSSLAAVRDALLTYELTTLLTSKQNLAYYCQHKGKEHPKTGKGATNGGVALQKERLFNLDEAYHIQIAYNSDQSQAFLSVSDNKLLPAITATLKAALNLTDTNISADAEKITLKIRPRDLIAILRRTATFYEGINVLTADGRLLLAQRHHKGLASAGGHHSDKYSQKSIAYGLYSEFGLVFKEPEKIEQTVNVLANVKTIAKTGIYIVAAEALVATEKAAKYAQSKNMAVAFEADTEEFDANTEVALTLSEMRGKKFYDVMPISELCQYQLSVLTEYLKSAYSECFNNLTFTIDTKVDLIEEPKMTYKIPGGTFGRMHITVKGEIPILLRQIFASHALVGLAPNEMIYSLDVSPFAIVQALKQSPTLNIEPTRAHSTLSL